MTVDATPAASLPPAPVTTFESLLAPLLEPAYRLACSLTRHGADAEDLLQEAALQAYRGFHSFIPGTNFRAWFYRILTNRHCYRYREAKRRPAAVELEDSPDLYLYARTAEVGLHAATDDPAVFLMSKMTAEQIRAAIAELSEEFRVVVSLHFVEEMSYQDISAVVGCPVGTVRSRLHRGRKMLQKKLWKIAQEAGIVSELTAEGDGS